MENWTPKTVTQEVGAVLHTLTTFFIPILVVLAPFVILGLFAVAQASH